MTTLKRSRGRPEGSCKHDDSKPLAELADLMLANPRLRIKTAASRIAPRFVDNNEEESVARRFVRAWHKQSESLLKQAAERRANRERVVHVGGGGGGGGSGYRTATGELLGYGHPYGSGLSASARLRSQSDSILAMVSERERAVSSYLSPVSELQRLADLTQRQWVLPASMSMQNEILNILRRADESRRLFERATLGWSYY
jgi:hypothetical protein